MKLHGVVPISVVLFIIGAVVLRKKKAKHTKELEGESMLPKGNLASKFRNTIKSTAICLHLTCELS